MAGRPRASWLAGIRSIGRAMLPGQGLVIHVRLTLEREPDREVNAYLSYADAIKWRNALTTMIEKTENGE